MVENYPRAFELTSVGTTTSVNTLAFRPKGQGGSAVNFPPGNCFTLATRLSILCVLKLPLFTVVALGLSGKLHFRFAPRGPSRNRV